MAHLRFTGLQDMEILTSVHLDLTPEGQVGLRLTEDHHLASRPNDLRLVDLHQLVSSNSKLHDSRALQHGSKFLFRITILVSAHCSPQIIRIYLQSKVIIMLLSDNAPTRNWMDLPLSEDEGSDDERRKRRNREREDADRSHRCALTSVKPEVSVVYISIAAF